MLFFTFIINLFLFLTVSRWANAIYDPTQVPNNKVGIHILFPGEIHRAARLVNNEGEGSWGYVTIPIQATDRDRDKWQQFFDKCLEEKVIPIIRVATVPEGSNWATPNNHDLIDFANFLGDLHWPVANRYVIIFNEVNRSDEYGGTISPESYADILNNAVDIFKERSTDFFILPSGLDNASINGNGALSWRTYLQRMHRKQPDIFDKIDGWTSHAYPNPDFSVRPDLSGGNKIDSFRYDLEYLKRYTTKELPVFITEAGWSNSYLSDYQVSLYYRHAMDKVWSDNRVVAVTPFILDAQNGPFEMFSFIGKNGEYKEFALTFSGYAQAASPSMSIRDLHIAQLNRFSEKTDQVLAIKSDSPSMVKKLYDSLRLLFSIFK